MKTYYLAVHFEDKSYLGNLTQVGFWEHYYIYEIEDHVLSRVDLLRTRPVVFPSKEVAMGWLFATAQRDSIKIPDRGGVADYVKTLAGNYMPYTKERIKYELTEDDVQAGITFAKLILHEKVDRDFENMWKYVKPQPYSPLLAEYITHVRLAADVDPALSHLIASHDKYNVALKTVADALYDTHVMIEQMADIPDVHAVLLHHFNQINDLPKTLTDKETDNVQRTVKS